MGTSVRDRTCQVVSPRGSHAGTRGAASAEGVAILPSPAQGPEPGPPGPDFLLGPFSDARCAGCTAWPAGWGPDPGTHGRRHGGTPNLFVLPFKSPPGTGNRAAPGAARRAPQARPRPRRPTLSREPMSHSARGWRAPLSRPHDPVPLHSPPGRGGQGRWCHCACADAGARSAPRCGSGEGLSPPPCSPRAPFLSPGVEPGRRGGRGRDAGPPLGCAGT